MIDRLWRRVADLLLPGHALRFPAVDIRRWDPPVGW